MAAVFDTPVTADPSAELLSRCYLAADVEALLPMSLLFTETIAFTFDHDEACQVPPALPDGWQHPVELVGHYDAPSGDSAIGLFHLLVKIPCCALVFDRLGGGEVELVDDLIVQGALVAFDRHQIIRLFVSDTCGNGSLSAHGIHRDQMSGHVELLKQLRDGGNFARFCGPRTPLPESIPPRRRTHSGSAVVQNQFCRYPGWSCRPRR